MSSFHRARNVAGPSLGNAPSTPTESNYKETAAPFHHPRVSRSFLALLMASVIAVFLLVTLGGIVRVTDSGLGCPDWPLCHGKLIPPMEFNTLIEYSHRLAASFTSILVVLVAIVAWRQYRSSKYIVVPVTAAVSLLGVEVILGGITVLTELPPTIVTIHLATAEAIFGLLLVTTVWSLQRQDLYRLTGQRVYKWALAAAMATFAVIVSGSYVVGRGAGTTCPGWPLCDGGLFPTYSLAWLHMTHRILAGLGGLLAAWVAILVWRQRWAFSAAGWASTIGGGILILQIMVGAANPWSEFSAMARVAHLSLATALWGTFVAITALAWRPRFASIATGKHGMVGKNNG